MKIKDEHCCRSDGHALRILGHRSRRVRVTGKGFSEVVELWMR